MRLAIRQAKFDALLTLRNPASLFFTVLLPILFLVILAALFGDGVIEERGGLRGANYFVPSIVALGVVSTTFVNLAISLTYMREYGQLKRLMATPLPPSVFVAGRVLSALAVSLLLVAALVLCGMLFYDVEPYAAGLPAAFVALLTGAGAFSALGIAVTAVIPNQDASAPIANAIALPLFFISGLFVPVDDAPAWMRAVADVFPVRHFAEALMPAFDPARAGEAFPWGDLAAVAAWGVAGVLLARRFFRWIPRREG